MLAAIARHWNIMRLRYVTCPPWERKRDQRAAASASPLPPLQRGYADSPSLYELFCDDDERAKLAQLLAEIDEFSATFKRAGPVADRAADRIA